MKTPLDKKKQKEETSFDYKFGFSMPEHSIKKTPKGISSEIVAQISHYKNEPLWMKEFRLKAYEYFTKRPLPSWGPDLSLIDFSQITYFLRATKNSIQSW